MGLSAVLVDWCGVLDDPGDPPEEPAPVLAAVRRLHACGIATALVSNSESRIGLPADTFDVCALSGELGSAKPAESLYLFALEELCRVPGECVFVDDARANVATAVRLGMVGVRHENPVQTVEELEVLFAIE